VGCIFRNQRPIKPRPGWIFPFTFPLRPLRLDSKSTSCLRHRRLLPSPPLAYYLSISAPPGPDPETLVSSNPRCWAVGGGGGCADCTRAVLGSVLISGVVMGCFLSCFRGGSDRSGDLRVSESTYGFLIPRGSPFFFTPRLVLVPVTVICEFPCAFALSAGSARTGEPHRGRLPR
jgi:hypothetical protein